jgi:hypothetical protein
MKHDQSESINSGSFREQWILKITKAFKKTLSISKDITFKLSSTKFSNRKFSLFIPKILKI